MFFYKLKIPPKEIETPYLCHNSEFIQSQFSGEKEQAFCSAFLVYILYSRPYWMILKST